MKSYFFSIIVFILLFFYSCRETTTTINGIDAELSPENISKLQKEVINSNNQFGYNLFVKLNETDNGNIFISPISLSLALGMTMNGAKNATLSEMKNTLQFNGYSNTEINNVYSNMLKELKSDDSKIILSIANSIWLRNNFDVESSFIETCSKYFSSKTSTLDFSLPSASQTINSWIEDNTNGKIRNMIEDNIKPDVMMYLINALYFKGLWTYTFDSKYTKEDYFTPEDGKTAKIQMMAQSGKYNHLAENNVQIVELPYGNGSYSMLILLPSDGIDNFLSSNNLSSLENYFASMKPDSGTIYIPKLKIEYENELSNILPLLGMKEAFTQSADFTAMHKAGGLYISRVKHKTYLEITEEGTEASAATVVEMVKTSIGPFSMKVNKPFLLIIRKKNNSILFIGKIAKPE